MTFRTPRVHMASGREPCLLVEILRARACQAGEKTPDPIVVLPVEPVERTGLSAAQVQHQVAITFHTLD